MKSRCVPGFCEDGALPASVTDDEPMRIRGTPDRRPPAPGYTLLELMVTVAIVALLVTAALPTYRAYSEKLALVDGRNRLVELMYLEDGYFAENATYTVDLVKHLGVEDTLSDKGRYRVTATACGDGIAECVRLSATPVAADSGLQTLTLDSRGARTPKKLWR